MEDLLYIKYFAVFFLVILSFGLTFQLVRKIADILIATLIIGAAVGVCIGIYNGVISSWPEITAISILLGIAACLICMPIIPFSSEYLNKAKGSSTNQQQAVSNEIE